MLGNFLIFIVVGWRHRHALGQQRPRRRHSRVGCMWPGSSACGLQTAGSTSVSGAAAQTAVLGGPAGPGWRSMTVAHVLRQLEQLLARCHLDPPLVPEIAEMYRTNRSRHDAIARAWTRAHATTDD